MKTEDKLVIVEQVLEFAIGWTIGGVVHSVVKPKKGIDNILTTVGTAAIAFVAGRKFAKEFVEICESKADVDLKDRLV